VTLGLQENCAEEQALGFRICYVASKAAPDQLADSLGLTLGATRNEMPHDEWWTAKLRKSGWTVLWSENEQFGQQSVVRIAELSNQFDTYICEVNETVMWSSSEFWSGGKQIWKVTHAGDGDDIFNFSQAGTLPASFSELNNKHRANQQNDGEGVDHIFEVPLDLAAMDIGFRHEDFLKPGDVETFQKILEPQKKSLFSRIFGR
jgi:hypothetical protein